MRKLPKDARSTGRKRGRNVLIRVRRPFLCADCGRGPKSFPTTYPKHLQDEELLAPVGKRFDSIVLECNHINKNILDNDPVNLEWLCKSCHKQKDSQTEKGVSIINDEFGYGSQPW